MILHKRYSLLHGLIALGAVISFQSMKIFLYSVTLSSVDVAGTVTS
nr:hypothetical protein [Halodesulfovibrio sp.]